MKNGFLHSRVIEPILTLLNRGITPEKIALSLAFGIVLGVVPVLGATTILCLAAALIFRLNIPVIQLVNYLIYPLQLFFLVPFIRMGEKLFRATPLQLSLAQILAMVRADRHQAFATLWLAGVHAVSAWLLIGPPTIFLLYFLLSWTLRRVATSSAESSHNTAAKAL
ncbi:MAG: DUF2062 domain-containing protein [Terriglobales bacterium]